MRFAGIAGTDFILFSSFPKQVLLTVSKQIEREEKEQQNGQKAVARVGVEKCK